MSSTEGHPRAELARRLATLGVTDVKPIIVDPTRGLIIRTIANFASSTRVSGVKSIPTDVVSKRTDGLT